MQLTDEIRGSLANLLRYRGGAEGEQDCDQTSIFAAMRIEELT